MTDTHPAGERRSGILTRAQYIERVTRYATETAADIGGTAEEQAATVKTLLRCAALDGLFPISALKPEEAKHA